MELKNIHGDPAAAGVVASLKDELRRLKAELEDRDEFADAQPPPGVDGDDFDPPKPEKGAGDG